MKLIKKHIHLLILSLLSLTISCEDLAFGEKFLQKPPSGDVTIDTIFSSAEYARRVLWYSYSKLPYGFVTGWDNYTGMYISNLEGLTDLNQSDIGYGGVEELYYNGLYNAGSEDATKAKGGTKYRFISRGAWTGIRHAWLFIENIDRVPDMDETEKKRLVAEAKLLIAIQYAEMLRHYGGLPIVDHAIKVEENVDMLPKRATLQETVDFIVRLLDEARDTPELPWVLSEDEVSNWDGRLTRAAAMGLKVRVLLFVASPLFNSETPYFEGEASTQLMTWFGNYSEQRWKDAAQAAKDFFDENQRQGNYYNLVQDGAYRMAFRSGYYDRGTSESLISTRRYYKMTNNGLFLQSVRWGSSCPTKEYFDMFPMADGSDFDWNNPTHKKNPFINRDPRLCETILLNEDVFGDHKAEVFQNKGKDPNYPKGKDWKKWPLDTKSLSSGLALRKFVLDRKGEYNQQLAHWPYLRLAEIYLSYAEALNEINRTEEAYPYINAVRERVGLNGLKKGLDKLAFRKAILRERACEFGWEEVRFFDLVRWKQEEVFTQRLHGLRIYRHKKTKEYEIEFYNLPERAWQKKDGFSPKWYLSAFPSKEVNKNYGLVQNPGWE